MTEIEQAYRITESITRTAARNFYYGIRLLPREKRAALSAVYALGRRIDDVADGELAPETKTPSSMPSGNHLIILMIHPIRCWLRWLTRLAGFRCRSRCSQS